MAGCGLFGPSRPDPRISLRTDVRPLPGRVASGDGLVVEVDGFAVDGLPAGKPMTAIARLITGPANEPLAGAASSDRVLVIEAKDLPAADQPLPEGVFAIQSARLVIPPGWRGEFGLNVSGQDSVGRDSAGRGLRVMFTAPQSGGVPELRIASHGAVEDDAITPGPDEAQTLALDWPLGELSGTFGIGIEPGRVVDSRRHTIWRIRVAGATDAETRAEVQSMVAASGPAGGRSPWAGTGQAVLAASAERQRGVLTVAALAVNADLCAELAILAGDKELDRLAIAGGRALNGLGAGADASSAGWKMDQAAILWAGELRAQGKLAKPIAATLAARFGEVGRDPGTLADLASKSGSSGDLNQRVIAEHLILLDDLAPGARVRSYDWLVHAGSAPAGFDPLGPAKERREAVEKHIEKLTQKAP